ncbi:MAG: pyridoxamine kinase [Clostridia bacterium]|nr:pyridoxamine kinase [Clostridia bacterium]
MNYKRILTIQDISCVGQCSLTVALPILSACGLETAILPSAVLSTHTAGFKGFTFRDLADDMPSILNHWVSENITFDCIYTGYLGSVSQVDYVLDIVSKTLKKGGKFFVDPAMADNGKLYPIFNDEYVKAMVRLCKHADYIIPNITEACFLTGVEYKEVYDRAYIDVLIKELEKIGCKNVILTGVSYKEGKTGVVAVENGVYNYYEHEKLANSCHGTGDIYSSAFVGAYENGKTVYEAIKIAADYTVDCIRGTASDKDHWYGAKFEPQLKNLIEYLK